MPDSDLLDRLADKFTVGDGCWEWTAALNRPDGYGTFTIDGKQVLAHRVLYELLVGPIPEGMELDHVRERGCRSRRCVRPSHLEPVTHAENVRRGDGGARERAKTHCPQGHAYDEANTRIYHGYRYCLACKRDRAREAKRASR